MIGKVTTLKHELGNDSVESRVLVSKTILGSTILASTENTEVLGGLGDYLVEEDEVDDPFMLCCKGGRLVRSNTP